MRARRPAQPASGEKCAPAGDNVYEIVEGEFASRLHKMTIRHQMMAKRRRNRLEIDHTLAQNSHWLTK
jgi:hypothetical protein